MKAAIIPAFLALAACARPAPAPLAIDDAWVRLPAVAGRPGAGYFTLVGGPAAARLVAVESARVGRIELHASMTGAGGMMAMRPLDGVDVAPGSRVAFAPGGNHAMLFGIRPDVTPGTLLPLAFRFADGKRLVASARIVAAGNEAPAS